MTPEEEKKLHDALTEAHRLTEDESVPAEGDFSLEEILAEYGGSTEQKLLAELEETAPTARMEAEPTPEPVRTPEPKQSQTTESRPAGQQPEPELPPPPRPISMEEVVSRTVDSVMEERRTAAETEPRHRRSLFSRRPLEETEELYAPPEPEPEPQPEWETIGKEPEPADEAGVWKQRWEKQKHPVVTAFLLSLIGAVLLMVDYLGRPIPYWSDHPLVRSGVMLVLLALVSILGRDVFARGFRALGRKCCSAELLTALSALVSLADCALEPFLTGRSTAQPYGVVACFALTFAMVGGARQSRGLYDTFRVAAVDEPPYMVTDTARGACKQQGRMRGFYTDVMKPDLSAHWQNALLPLVLVASVVFAGLSSLGQGRGSDFLLNWSAILAASASFALPLSYALPWSRLTQRLQKSGCVVAGWSGVAHIGRQNRLIVTDEDLFPPGTVGLNGIKVFGEELPRAVSYAASLAVASGSGLARLFDSLLRSEGGRYEPVTDFSFYEEGGCSGVIHGESVLLGTASFMRKMEVRLPSGLNLRTGVFLAVDRQLTAVFAVKYKPAETVDWALHMLRRSRITLVLAARDPNLTPELIRRKFGKGARLEYPSLSERVALSEQERGGGMPRALLYREGLLPYAEAAAGSRRLRGACRRGSTIALLGSICGTLLAFYLTFQGAYALLSPLSVLAFQLLWALPVLILSDWVGRL